MSENDPERICGASTSDGGYCQNGLEECRHHERPGPDVERVREALDAAVEELTRDGGGGKRARIGRAVGHLETARESLASEE